MSATWFQVQRRFNRLAVRVRGRDFSVLVDDDSVLKSFGEMPGDVVEAFQDEWSRYQAEKAKRTVVISAQTMKPISEAPVDNTPILCAVEGGWFGITSQFLAHGVLSRSRMGADPLGWWPLPDMSPMPAEFAGWDV